MESTPTLQINEKDILDLEPIVTDIVTKWNQIVTTFENTTIQLCLMIKEATKVYSDKTTKEILQKVKQHPNIKKTVSLDRIWQGMRLIRDRPELIRYHVSNPESRQLIPPNKTPYLKKDGEIFWEFYFELAKQPLDIGTLAVLEEQGKQEKWSFRKLREEANRYKSDDEHGARDLIKQAKHDLIKKGSAILTDCKLEKLRAIVVILEYCKKLPIENVRGVLTFCKELEENGKR